MHVQNSSDPLEKKGPAYQASSLWLYLAGSALTLSGVLAFLLALARVPALKWIVSDPMFFRRALVVHVNLGLTVWVFAFIASLFSLLPGRSKGNRSAPIVSAIGVLILSIIGLSAHSVPVLSNYVPAIDHPVFLVGLAIFGVGIVASFVDFRLISPIHDSSASNESILPKSAGPFLRSSAIAFLISVQVIIFAFITMPPGLLTENYYEIAFWGGGHVLMFAAEAGKIVVWMILIYWLTKQDPLSLKKGNPSFVLSVIFILPVLILLPFTLSQSPVENSYRELFTSLMRWGIFPVSTIVGLILIWRWYRFSANDWRKSLKDPVSLTFVLSIALTISGFVFGALIRDSNTMVPAHYHAAAGAVTLAFMGVTPILFKRFKLNEFRFPKLLYWQPILYGTGQFIFALGFAIAGVYGMGRKLYGSEQQVRGVADWIGLTLVGLGGFIAVLGGLIYMAYFTHCLAGSIRQSMKDEKIKEETVV